MAAAGPKPGVTLRRSLIVAAFTIALVALGVFLASAYLVVYVPATSELATAQLRAASQQVEARMQTLVKRVEAVARLSHDWGTRGLIDVGKPQPFNDLLRPLIANGPNLSSVVAADDHGKEILLMPGDNGRWINRLTDPEQSGKRATFLTWDQDFRLEKSEVTDLDYDARQRPWLKGALALPSDSDIFWTAPFIYRSSHEPGISAVVRWTAADGRVLAMTHDLKLLDLSRFTREIVAGSRGFATIFTGDGQVIGLPRDARFARDDAVKAAVLHPVTELGLSPLARGFQLWDQSGRGNDKLLRVDVDGTSWLCIFKSLQFGTQTFWVATFAPASDFVPTTARNALPVLALVVGTLLLAWLIATRLASRFTQPLERLAAESVRIGRLQLDQPVTVRSSWRELDDLGQAQEQMRLALLTSTRHLADANESLEAKVAERTRALEASEAAARAATRAKSDFLANMSHEIRTPMNAIIGMAHLTAKGGLPPRQHDQVLKIQQASHHLLGIIDDILDSSKIETGKLELESRSFTLADVTENVETLVGQRAAAKDLSLSFEIDPAIPPVLVGDPLRLGQILINYTSNAMKFTERGTVRVAVRLTHDRPTDVLLEFAVTDTGIGLSAEEIGRLFQPFQQADPSTTRRYGGSGLGLLIAKNLAELMGGRAGVESVVGQGSRFWFTARLGKSPSAVEHSDPRLDLHLAGRGLRPGARVLVAEDNDLNQEVAIGILVEWGLDVDVASNGEAAVKMARDGDYDVILMDMQMPVMDGLSATRAIRTLPGRLQVPIIALTANAMGSDRARCLAAGMNDHVAKPLDPTTLWQTLLRWLPATPPPSPSPSPDKVIAGAGVGQSSIEPLRIPGLDPVAALRRVGGRTEFYLSLLRRFADGQEQTALAIDTAIKAGDRATAMMRAHALRGMAANLGAIDVQDSAAAVEEALARETPTPQVTSLLAALAGHLDPLVQELKARIPLA